MGARLLFLHWLLLFAMKSVVTGSHFRGGVITARPTVNPNEMEVSFHVSWRLSYGAEGYCDQTIVDGGWLIGSGDLVCQAGCSNTTPISSMQYRCTDFSFQEDWTFGERQFNYTFQGGPGFTIGFTCGDWVAPIDAECSISTNFSTTRRNDTGRINSTPNTITSPVVQVQAGCNHTIRIPVSDPDGDTVRCRWATGTECAGVCGAIPGAVLDPESCIISFTSEQVAGHEIAAIVIEDFANESSEPLSSVGLQFLVEIFNSERSCFIVPEFIPPTLRDGSCVAIPTGTAFQTTLTAVSGSEEETVTEIQTVSPVGAVKSELEHDPVTNAYSVSIVWTPTANQENLTHHLCFLATNSIGMSSTQSCISLLPGHHPPKPLNNSANPNREAVPPTNTSWHISFNQDIQRPTLSSFILFHDARTNNIVYQINSSSLSELLFPSSNSINLRPNYEFPQERDYYITFERAVVVGLEGCGPGNEPVVDRDFWTFSSLDKTPPQIIFIQSPAVSNVNISISWRSNEEAVWQCMLRTETLSLDVNCSEGSWTGYNLQGGVYSLEITGRDEMNNTATVIHTFTVDITPPNVTFLRVPGRVTRSLTVLFQFGCEESCTYQCLFREEGDLMESVFFPCSSSYRTQDLVHGKHYTLTVIATDRQGNIGEPSSYSWEADFEPPVVFGVGNSSASCIGIPSPTLTGQAEAVDNGTSVDVRFHDQRRPCYLERTWMAVDIAGNIGTLIQYISLEYNATLNFVPDIRIPCDSAAPTDFMTITATLPNPCQRPLNLDFEDVGNSSVCPSNFIRNWTITDECNSHKSHFEQVISLYEVCATDACGRNQSPARGVCIQGDCLCNSPWFGGNCAILVRSVEVSPMADQIIQEYEDYSEVLNISGTPPLSLTLLSAPDGMLLSQVARQVSWQRAQAENYTIEVEIQNQVSVRRVSWQLVVKSGYDAVLNTVNDSVFFQPSPIRLTGQVEYFEGNRVSQLLSGVVPVIIEISSQNGIRELSTFTNQDRTFSVTFFPAPTEFGTYTARAKHPRSDSNPSHQINWIILGMTATPRIVRLRNSTVSSFQMVFRNVSMLRNEGPRVLTGITASPSLGSTETLGVEIEFGQTLLEPNAVTNIDIEVRASRALRANFPVRIDSTEGVSTIISVNVQIDQILPELVANPASLYVRVVRGMLRTLDFNITNVGTISATKVMAVLPNSNFLSLVSFGNAMQTESDSIILASEESAQLSVLASIPPDQALGEISGRIVISAVETFLSIPFTLVVSSNMLMNLTVRVEDEYSYFAEGLPLVNNAVVRLSNNMRDFEESLTAGETGIVTFLNILEDRYQIFVSGPSHTPVNQVIVTSAEESTITIFIARRAVSYSFTVVPTTFDESYTITLEADFETHVPIPVVTITPLDISLEPYELGLENTIQYNVTNHGLIRTDDVAFRLPTSHPFLEFSSDLQDIGSLQALTSIIIPVKVTRREERREKRDATTCAAALLHTVGVVYSYVCGVRQERSSSAVLRGFSRFSDCGPTERLRPLVVFPVQFPIGSSGRGNPVHPNIGEVTYTPTPINCDKCIISLVGCIPFAPPYACLHLAFSAIKGFLQSTETDILNRLRDGLNPGDIADMASLTACLQEWKPRKALKKIAPYLCIPGVLRDCLGFDTTPLSRKRSLGSIARETVQSVFAMQQFILLGVEVLGDDRWVRLVNDPVWLSDVFKPVLSDTSDGGILITNAEYDFVTSTPPPINASLDMVQALLHRFNNTFYGWNNGILEPENGSNIMSYSKTLNFTNDMREFNDRIVMSGRAPFLDSYNEVIGEYNMIDNFDEEGVCAVVRIRIDQEIALTRNAFLARLEIENMEISDLENIQVEFFVVNVGSSVESTDLFVIGNETLTGSLQDSENGLFLPSGQTGALEWLIVPLSEAAPTENQDYNVGGTFYYMANGENISAPLLPTRITVAPDPSLVIHYFWEKYVTGDNPFTDVIESSVPFVLGVAIHNAGYGTAMNLRITSGQPEIIDNDKGLLVSFRIIGTRVGSESVTPSLSVDFGDIPAMTTRVARWLMISSLQGEFMNYSATFEYMNPLGDPRLSVLDELVIHELIRNVFIYTPNEDDGILDFLVNDRRDFRSIPDALYSSRTFTRYNVSRGEITSLLSASDSEYIQVNAVSNFTGWASDMRGLLILLVGLI